MPPPAAWPRVGMPSAKKAGAAAKKAKAAAKKAKQDAAGPPRAAGGRPPDAAERRANVKHMRNPDNKRVRRRPFCRSLAKTSSSSLLLRESTPTRRLTCTLTEAPRSHDTHGCSPPALLPLQGANNLLEPCGLIPEDLAGGRPWDIR